VAIRRASIVTRADSSGAAAKLPTAPSAAPDPNASANAAPEIPEVTVMAPRPPTDAELAGDSLYQFIVHHATVHYFNTGVTGRLASWVGGKQSICPTTKGLNPEQDDYVTARIRALATYVGAPVQPGPQCEYNVTILFTNNPQEEMEASAHQVPALNRMAACKFNQLPHSSRVLVVTKINRRPIKDGGTATWH
jgi:hypothetical protein